MSIVSIIAHLFTWSNMTRQKTYSTAEICEMFDISKSTLFRWEQDGILPNVSRDMNNQRLYSDQHIRVISQKQIGQLKQQFARAIEASRDGWGVFEAVSLRKFIEGDITGLRELAAREELSVGTIYRVVQIALDRYEPHEDAFAEAMHVAWHGSSRLGNVVKQSG